MARNILILPSLDSRRAEGGRAFACFLFSFLFLLGSESKKPTDVNSRRNECVKEMEKGAEVVRSSAFLITSYEFQSSVERKIASLMHNQQHTL